MRNIEVWWPKFQKRTIDGIPGLVTVVVQDRRTNEILTVDYTDEAGFRKTLMTGRASFYSPSRKKSWVKGEESGNFQKVTDMVVNCSGDTLIYIVEMEGQKLACHTGARSCFYRPVTRPEDAEQPPKAGEAERLKLVRLPVVDDL